MPRKTSIASHPATLRRHAETRLRGERKARRARSGGKKAEAETGRVVHELEVHQIELELQNAELRKTRDELEAALENYTDLYDFAPVGYFTLAASGAINQANLTGANLVEIERSRLVGRHFELLLPVDLRPAFNTFLNQVFASPARQSGDFKILRPRQLPRIVNIEAQRLFSRQECRVAIVDIAERNRAAEAVRLSEVRYRRLFEAAHDGVLILDPGTRKITDANPFMIRLLGYSHDQLVGKELFEIGLLQDEAASRAMFQELKNNRAVRYDDLPLKSLTGRAQEVEVVANLYQEDGRAVIQCNIRDITERKLAEHELAEKARLLDLSHDAIIVRDMKGHIRYWNHGAEELYGWSRKEALGKLSHRLLRTQFPVSLSKMTEELHRTDRWVGELVHTRRNGQGLTVLARKTLDRDSQHRPVAVLENITDITKRKESEERLRRSEALFGLLIAQVPVGIYLVDAQFCLRQVNPTARRIFLKVHPLLGRNFSEIVHTLWPRSVAATVVARFRHTLKTGEPYQSPEFAERRRDTGMLEVYEWQIQRVTLPAGEHGVVCFFSDITERKQAEAAQRRLDVLTASNQKLEQEIVRRRTVEESLRQSEQHQRRLLTQSRLMQEKLRHLSRQVLRVQEEERKRISRELHDVIAQTLTGINLRLASLKQGVGLSNQGFDRHLARTQRMVAKSVDIVHQFARELRPAVLDDLGLIPALYAFMKSFTTQTGIRTQLTAFAGVERLDTARRTVLFRVAQEALTNVARHAHTDHVAVSIKKLPESICLKITDAGKSFDVDHALQANRGKRLGLLGMRERLEMVGGRLEVVSAPGKGTTITGEIPLEKIRGGGADEIR